MTAALRKPFYVGLEGPRGAGKSTLAGNLRTLWRDAVNTPFCLLDPGLVTPVVEAMRSSERQQVLHEQRMLEWLLRERPLLEGGELVYVFLDPRSPAALSERTGRELEEVVREVGTFRVLMLERAALGHVLLFDPDHPDGPEGLAKLVAGHLERLNPSAKVTFDPKEVLDARPARAAVSPRIQVG
ncbi:MAG: hypothetical protein IT377_12175 [Polyangiaceae bacterium]|nr:hypothetical protein [Polyangiaceae bacterium]